MRIDILKVEGNVVTFSGVAGTGVGQCMRDCLKAGMKCDVELDFDELLKPGKNVDISVNELLYLESDGRSNIINALVEATEEDGEVCLRLSADCIIVTYQEGAKIQAGDYVLLTLLVDSLKLSVIGVDWEKEA